ncbi:hypothetical protein A8A01_03230 [Ewingella americana]|nr:hypothetical protein A8A01_03230 [Ewingella americana]
MKVHMRSEYTEKGMPSYLKDKYHRDGYFGAVCGYMRRGITSTESSVTCLICLKNMKDGLK